MLTLKTPPTALAVSVAEAKAHCKVEVPDDDLLIEMYIRAATEVAEQRTGRSIMLQGWLLTLDGFPPGAILLRNIPVASVVSVKYIDPDGAEITLGTQRYQLNAADDFAPAELQPAYGERWPATRSQSGAVRIEYTAGYSTLAAVPHSVRSWILLQVGAMYANREAESGVQTFALGFADSLLDRTKVWSL
jgi:uncharacterized phiE125 gp8 family phage protein